ncbi:helix-turn-helix transcriptional regulator [Pendulispora rubella]|uniref:Helix-turn-helix transcriptional regulator n=1 Tax=Pendulispora rubella TaxID=2741070 RepID=A0ABZ2KTG6_9BACT
MKRRSLQDNDCPIARSLDTIGDWWSLLIVRDALIGKRRFSDFQKSLGLAKNILAARLRKLVADGVLELAPASDGSAYQEYVLTDKGRDLMIVLVALRQWGEHHLFPPGECDNILVDIDRGEKVAPLRVLAKDGRALTPSDVRVSTRSDASRGRRTRS